jgi:outer membrane protein assembly factor BamA
MAAALPDPGRAAKFTDLEHTRIEEPRPADVPSDAELEAAGAVIGRIDIDTRNIFNEHDPRETNGLFMLANRVHIRTKPGAIKAQLLFASGDKYRASALAETERNLRLLDYLYDARVVPVHYAEGKVDVKVITKDVWTLTPGVSIGRAGGVNSTSFDIQDENLLGFGKSLEIARGSSVDRTSDSVIWSDPNVFGSHWTSAVLDVHSSDGGERAFQAEHPFYSLDTRWETKVTAVSYDRTISRYNLGQIVDQFKDDETSYELSGGISDGLIDGWTRRWLAGVRYDRNVFRPDYGSSMPAAVLPADRTLSYPFVGFDIAQDRYKKTGDENQIGRTEDFFFGTEVSGELGYSSSGSGATQDAIMLALHALRGYEFGSKQQLFLEETFNTRIEEGRARNLVADGGAKYYWRWHEDHLFYAAISTTFTNALDPELQLLIGGDNGLRGYPLRYESGTSRALFTLEERFYSDWFPYRLVRVGGAIFSDVGRTWGRGSVGNSDPGLLRDLGFGLRVGNSRSGLGNVLHVDVAFPLNALAGISRVQFLVGTQQTF